MYIAICILSTIPNKLKLIEDLFFIVSLHFERVATHASGAKRPKHFIVRTPQSLKIDFFPCSAIVDGSQPATY
jgi:hypothetical protein